MFQREESVIVIVIVNLFDCDFYCAGKEPEEKCTADSDCKTGEECKNGVCTTKTTTKTNTTTIIIIIIGGIVFFYLVKTGKIKLPGGKKNTIPPIINTIMTIIMIIVVVLVFVVVFVVQTPFLHSSPVLQSESAVHFSSGSLPAQ